MNEFTVTGPIDGLYHVGYQSAISNTFYSISEFVSKELAHVTADRMNDERRRAEARINDGR